MTIAATPVPLSEAKARLSELARRVRQQHERIMLTRNGEPEAALLSVDDLEGLEMTLEILGDSEAVARISESLAAPGRSDPGEDLAMIRQDLALRPALCERLPTPASGSDRRQRMTLARPAPTWERSGLKSGRSAGQSRPDHRTSTRVFAVW